MDLSSRPDVIGLRSQPTPLRIRRRGGGLETGDRMSQEEALAEAKVRIEEYRSRIQKLDEDSLDLMFREARNQNWWQDRPVSDDQLREIWDLAKLGSTSGNCVPARICFCARKNPGNAWRRRWGPAMWRRPWRRRSQRSSPTM